MEWELKDHLIRLNVKIGDITLFADVTEYSRKQLDLTLGMDIYIGFKAAAIVMVKI